jgi:hypothetical protein
MALTLIEQARLYVYDVPANEQFYPLFGDEDWEFFLEKSGDDPLRAARLAATTALRFKFTTLNSKEKFGDIEAWNNSYQTYNQAIKDFINDKGLFRSLPVGLTPYAAGISVEDIVASLNDPDNPRLYNYLFMCGIEETSCASETSPL